MLVFPDRNSGKTFIRKNSFPDKNLRFLKRRISTQPSYKPKKLEADLVFKKF